MGKGPSPAPAPSSQTVTNTSIPEYARPYVEEMLGKSQALTGTGYQPYGGQRIAEFSPLQQQTFQTIAGLQTPAQYGAATQAMQSAMQGALGTSYTPTDFANQYQAPGGYTPGEFSNQYRATDQYTPSLFTSQYATPDAYRAAQFSAQNVSAPSLQQYQMAGPQQVGTSSFIDPGTAQAYMSPYIQQALNPQLAEIQRQSDIAQQGLRSQAAAAGAFGGSRQALQSSEQARNAQTLMSQATGQGYQSAYDRAMQQYSTDAARRMQAAMANQAAGLTTGQANLQAALGVQALGAGQSLQAQLANQQAQMAAQQAAEQSRQYGYGQQMNAAQQAAQFDLAAKQAAEQSRQYGYGQGITQQQLAAQYGTAAQQAAEQARQYGYGQQMTAAQQAAQYGLAAQQAAEQSRQYGAGLGLQGLQTAMTGAGQLANIGGQQFGAQQNILGMQQQVGTAQQAQAQQAMDMAYQDFLKQRNYPYQQLAFMSDMLRGLPLAQSAQQMYTAPPSAVAQLGGLGMAGLGAYGAMGGFRGKEGGVIKAKEGGLMGIKYAVGGDIESLSKEQLEKLLESPNLTPLEQAQIETRLMLLRRMEMNPESSSIMADQGQQVAGVGAIPTGEMVPQDYARAGGGIIAFAKGSQVSGYDDDDEEDDEDEDDLSQYILPTGATSVAAPAVAAPAAPAVAPSAPGLPPAGNLANMNQYIDLATKDAMARRDIPLSPAEIARQERLGKVSERSAESKDMALAEFLMQTGFGAAASRSPYALQAFGESGAKATPSLFKGIQKAKDLEELASKELAEYGRAQRAEKLAGVSAGEKIGAGAASLAAREQISKEGIAARERLAEKGLASRERIAKIQRESMERIAQSRQTNFQMQWGLYVQEAKDRGVKPSIAEFKKLFPETKSGGYLRDIIKGDPMGKPEEWYAKADQLSRLENLSDEDKAALRWAKENPKDPRSAAIKSRLGL